MGGKVFKEKNLIFIAGTAALITAILAVSSIFTMSAKARELPSGYKYYTSIVVEKGDTLWDIANQYITPEYGDIREKLGLNRDSRVLFFSTEGDTDKENYRSIVWDGAYGTGN